MKTKKIFTVLNTITFVLGVILYTYISFFQKINLGTKYKELENIILIAIPCLLLFVSSFMESDKRARYLKIYLLGYTIALASFVFSSSRSNVLIEQGIMSREYNLIPFNSIVNLFQSQLGLRFAIYNIVGNFLMLTPLAILLPMIHDKFKNTKTFLLVVGATCLLIEITQYISGLGSCDIDDFILNVSGAFLLFLAIEKTKGHIFLEYLFLEKQVSSKICLLICSILLVVFYIFFVKRSLLIYAHDMDQKIDMSNVSCVTNKKVYLGEVGNDRYYSKCDYGDSYILVGRQKYTVKEFIKSQSFNDKLFQKLNLVKKKIITDVILKGKSEQKNLLFENEYSKVFLYGYTNLLIEKDGELYDLEKELENKEIDISIIHHLTTLELLDVKNGYTIENGTYFNILTCGGTYSQYNEFYILDSNWTITRNSCDTLTSISYEKR